MLHSQQKNKLGFLLSISLLLFMLGAFLFVMAPTKVFARQIDVPSYLHINSQSSSFQDQDTVFLDEGEVLSVTLGKPSQEIPKDAQGQALPFTSQSQIGGFALTYLESAFSLKINGENITDNLRQTNFLKFEPFIFQPTTIDSQGNPVPSGSAKTFVFMDLEIDLSEDIFKPGEYTFTFTDYGENSENNFSYSQNASFSFTLYIFNTTDYFSSNSASSQNITFENVEAVVPNTVSFRNYYYFNYSNLYATNSSLQNHLPVLSFDASKFTLSISKTTLGSTFACEISKFNTNLVTLSKNTTEEFVFVSFNKQTNLITVVFSDVGEYVLDYTFIYERYNHEKVELLSNEITAANSKNDVLYVYGGQVYHSGKVNKNTELKLLSEDNLATKPGFSADITYLLGSTTPNILKADDVNNFEEDDQSIKSIIKSQNITPVSTNQPAVIFNINATLNTNLTKMYKAEKNNQGEWEFSTSQKYLNSPITESGTYLLKLVYNFDYYYTNKGHSASTQFVQYFFFSINNSIPSVKVTDASGTQLNSYSFTNKASTVTLEAQSPFNSQTLLEVYSKSFIGSSYTFNQSISGNLTNQTLTFNAEGNYMVKLLYGKNLTKSQTLYFTIDKTEISGVNVLPVVKNNFSNGYEKLQNPVSFFTNQEVVVEWQEKLSGASTKAYYKYIPFQESPNSINSRLESTVSGIITSYKLNLDVSKLYDKATYHNTLNTISGSSVFTNQGLYIVYICDEAGHEKYISFCIDKSPLQVLQTEVKSGDEKFISGHELVDTDQYLQWGSYKLIELGVDAEDIENIQDTWIKDTITNLYNPLTNNFSDNIHSLSSKLYFSVEISKVYAKQTGTSLKLVTDNHTGLTLIELTSETSSGVEYANEITYGFYLIDESNLHFDYFSSLYGQNATQEDAITLIQHANKSFQITTSTDASNANVVINETQNLNDVSLISQESTALLQAGFADSRVNATTGADLRTKYYFTTGQNANGNISILSYRIKLDINSNLNVSKITMYFYPFVVNSQTGTLGLSQTATVAVIYDTSNSTNALIALSGSGNEGYYAFNINVDYDNSTGTYQTAAGKYVILREYNNPEHINQYDFSLRESVFIVDRADIISSPQSFNDSSKSAVGSGVYVNILNGSKDAVQFTNIYSAKNNPSTYILQTNKLPVVVYVPEVKYGNQNTLIDFITDKTLTYYLTIENDMLIRFCYLDNQTEVTKKSALNLIFFGDLVVTEMFDKNPNVYKNTDFDLTVTIQSSSGQTIQTNVNGLNYFLSNDIITNGVYTVTITQNPLNGNNFPNVSSTFKFSFQIISSPPNFAFTSISDTQNAITFETDALGVTYTNENGKIKVIWTDPQNQDYYAKIDTTQDANGYTPISYYFTSTSGSQISQTMRVKASDIATDLSSPRTHYFYIDLGVATNNIIVNVYMQNVRGTVSNGSQTLLDSLTSITKKLYIDRTAPSENLSFLISKTQFEGINFGEYARKFVSFDGIDATNGEQLYSVPLSTGALAKYAFAVQNTELNPLIDFFKTKNAINGFYTEGYYFNIQQIQNIEEYSLPSIASLISNAKTSLNQPFQTFHANTYYEITEIDLAGNASVYIIFVVDGLNKTVLQFDREKTDKNFANQIMFNELSLQQDIYAKTFLNITSLNLYSYEFLLFSLDDEIYFMSSALNANQAYEFSSYTSVSSSANVVNLANLLSFTPNSHHTLKLCDTIKGITYTFDLYISNLELSYNLLTTSEGLSISAPNLTVTKLMLSEIEILSYDTSLDRYVSIYNANQTFNSNAYVKVNLSASTYTFQILNPQHAYSYIFYDNYGNKYLEHHTLNSFVLSEEQKVKNYLETTLITETIDGQVSTDSWYVGKSNIIYNYSSADYYAYIKIYVLEIKENIAVWTLKTDTLSSEYGVFLNDKQNFNISQGGAIYASLSVSPLHETVKQLVLFAPSQNLLSSQFTGGAYKFEITLLDQYDDTNSSVIVDKLLINNLTPIIELKDKNNISVGAEDAMYSEQLAVIVPVLPTILTLSDETDISKFMFNYQSEIIYNQTSEPLVSGQIVEKPGNYEIRVYIKLNQNLYQVTTKPFVISESATAFYEVLVRDGQTGLFVNALPTGNSFTYNNITYFNHFIVNDEFNLFLNKNQYMEKTSSIVIPSPECTTYIYTISNFNYASSHLVTPYTSQIAISYIPKTTSIITANQFVYETNDATQTLLSGTNKFITITQNDADIESIVVKFNGYYAINENIITAKIETANTTFYASSSNPVTSFTLSTSGNYTITFQDLAGNVQLFTDSQGIEQVYFYQIRFIKGVPYFINGNTPIKNGIYNDKVTITLPSALKSVYDPGGKPSIVIYKNDTLIEVEQTNGEYNLTESGYYKVFFNARVANKELRQESYEFLILSSKEYRSIFEFSEYGNYQIETVFKNGIDITSQIRNNYNLSSTAPLKAIAISLYDEKTGQGNYSIKINTNSGRYITQNNLVIPEYFTFNFIIKPIGTLPIKISINEGTSTTDVIKIQFNALDLYEEVGKSKIMYAGNTLNIDEEYIDSLNGNNYVELDITENGTHFVQIYGAGDNLLHSYKVIKTEPLNTVSILLIVLAVAAAIGITVTIVLLRKRMKIK